MQIIKKNARNLTERFIGSSFAQKSVMAAIALIISTSNVMAGSKGAAGFTQGHPGSQLLPDSGIEPDEGHCCRYRSGRCLQRLFQDAER